MGALTAVLPFHTRGRFVARASISREMKARVNEQAIEEHNASPIPRQDPRILHRVSHLGHPETLVHDFLSAVA